MLTYNKAKKTEYYSKVKDRNQEAIKQVIKANDFLLKQHGKSFLGQSKEIISKGISFNRAYYYYLRNGDRGNFSGTYANIFSVYWDIPLVELLLIGQRQG